MRQLLIAALLSLPLCGHATIINFDADLSPANEVPAVTGSAATGVGFLSFDTLTNNLTWSISFNDLTGPAVIAHLHSQLPGSIPGQQNGGVQVDLNSGFFSGIGSSSGVFLGAAILSTTQAATLFDNLWYVNIHTAENAPGEIRGQVLRRVAQVPEPGTLGLLGAGLLGLGFMRRKQAA